MQTRSSDKVALSAWLTAVFFLLTLAYYVEIARSWSLSGFSIETNLLFFALSFALIVAYPHIAGLNSSFRGLTLLVIFSTFYIPALILASAGGGTLRNLTVIFCSLISITAFSALPLPSIKATRISQGTYLTALCLMIALFVLLLGREAGFSNLNFDLYSVYDFRRDIAANIGETLNRLASIFTKLLIPLLLVYALQEKGNKRVTLVGFALGCSILIFGYWQHKSAAFLPFAALLLYLGVRAERPAHRITILLTLLCTALAVEALYYAYFNPLYAAPLNGLIGRRALFVPALLDQYYIDYFSNHEKNYWYSLTQHFGALPPTSSLAAPFRIGLEYFDNDQMSANSGFVGAGYANAGAAGVMLYSTIIGLFISYADAQAKTLGNAFVFALGFPAIYTAVASSDLVTALFSHGLIAFLIALPFLAVPKPTK